MKNTNLVVQIVILLIGLGVGFGGGYFFRNHQLARVRGNFANGQFQRNGARLPTGQGMMGSRGVIGSILSLDDKSITVKLPDGSSKIVLFTDATIYSNTVTAAKNDLKVGENVAVFGAANSDGSVTATSVQINPEFGRMMSSPTPGK